MDVKDHKNPTSSGHDSHGVHLCHQCGWPFPNPHPSAKHRRAHKKVCGKIEGYKLFDSETERLSDDEHLSDDDMKTPSPKMEKGGVKELGSSDGIGLKSYKSEDDVFSDAVTEFSDSGVSPSIDERLESLGQLDENVGEDLVPDLNDSELSKDNGNAGKTPPLDDPKGGREISNPDVGSMTPISDIRCEEVSFGVNRTDDLQIDSSAIVCETVTENINTNGESGKHKELISSTPETAEVKESANEESFTEYLAPLSESRLEEMGEKGSDPVVPESMVLKAEKNALDTLILEHKLHEGEGNRSHAVTASEIIKQDKELSKKLQGEVENVILEPISHEADEKTSKLSTVGEIGEQENELTNVLRAEMTKYDHPHQTDPPKHPDASITTQVEADSSKDTTGDGHEKLAVLNDLKGDGGKNMHLPSVAEILPTIENPDIMVVDFKNYKVLRSSSPLDLGDADVTRSAEDENKVTVSELDPSSISSVPIESLHRSHSDFSSLDCSLEKEGVLAPIGGEVDTSESRVISQEGSGTNGLEASPETSGFETRNSQTNYALEGFQPNSADEESLKIEVSAPSRKAHSDEIPVVSSIDEQTCKQTTDSDEVENADGTVIESSDHVRTESRMSHSLNEDDTSSSPKCMDEVYVEASQGLELCDNMEVLKSEGGLGLVSELNPEDPSLVSDKNLEISNMEAQKSMGAIAAVSELNPEDHSLVLDKNTEVSSSKEPQALPVAYQISSQISAVVEDNSTRDAMTSEPLVDEGNGKLTKEHLNVSAVNNSVVSSSRTESLDGNWGSVSDGTVLADAEMLSSTGTQAEEKSEGALLKPQAATKESHPDKSDVFDSPSFMTLVEYGAGADRKVADSEIDTVQKAEQPKSEALQAGWFPSLTNIVNESEGRKKNEEIIAKVTNQGTGMQRSPLKYLLSEAYSETKVESAAEKQGPSVNQADQSASKNNGAVVTTVSSIMGSETPGDNAAKKEMEKEWNSPARYPTVIKKEKKKGGKPYWVPFVCCTSVPQDI